MSDIRRDVDDVLPGPGPIERSWWAQLYFRVFRRWPKLVVRERLDRAYTAEMIVLQHFGGTGGFDE